MAGALSPVGVQSWCDGACVNLIFSYLCEPVLFSFLKLGATSVMVTAVSKTKPSPSQFMPLVVCSLTIQ